MKKYLIKGLLALFVGGFTASCADKDGDYVSVGQQKATAYADAFKELIGGEVAPNHDWGFKKTSIVSETSESRAMTRTAINVNGNEEKYENAPSLKDNEENEIRDYVRQLTTTPHVAPTGLKNYFVTQVHDGEEYYTNADGGAGILGSAHMNRLMILMQQGGTINNGALSEEGQVWMHINNFNHGDNTDWNGNTLVEDGGTFDFAYHGTEDNQYHNRWISVKGEDVDAYYNARGTYSGAKYAGFYYICFDFEATIGGPTTVSNIEYYDPETQSWQNSSTINIPGIYTKEEIESLTLDLEVAIPVSHYDSSIPNQWGGYGVNVVDRWVNVNLSNSNQVRKATFSNVQNGNQFIAGNDIYDDWIVRLVEATPIGGGTPSGGETSSNSTSTRKDRVERSRLVRQGRIFCEDLGTNADKISKSDIDFNDAVFDAKIWRKGQFDVEYLDDTYNSESDYLENIYTTGIKGIDIEMDENRDAHVVVNGKFKYVAEICLLAAGGTIPLKIGGNNGFEIHSKFGQGQNPSRNIAHTTIINTVGAPSQEQFTTTVSTDVCDAVTVEVDITEYVKKAIEGGNTDIGLDIIPIDVEWVSGNHQSVGELSSEYGQAPQKLCVPIGTPWVYERIPITTAFKDFEKYAKEYSPSNPLTFWDLVKNTIDTNYLYANGPEGMTAEEKDDGTVDENSYHDRVVTEGTTTTTTVVETVLWEGEMSFGANDANQTIKLYSTTFDAGNDIRIYGSSNGGQLTLQNSDSQNIISPSLNFSNVGYADSSVDESQAGQLSSGPSIIVAARNCTITKICKVVKTTTTK